jgi:hypothetical protein
MILEEMGIEIHKNALAKGFWDNDKILGYQDDLCLRVALVHSELSELLEAVRKHIKVSEHITEISGTEEEVADCVIRLLDMNEGYNWKFFECISGFDWSKSISQLVVLAHSIVDNSTLERLYLIGYENHCGIEIGILHRILSEFLMNDACITMYKFIIHLFYCCGIYGWNIEKAIELKMNYNLSRSKMHGGKAF